MSIGSFFSGIWQGVVGQLFRKAAVKVVQELAEGLKDLAVVSVNQLAAQGENLMTAKGRKTALRVIENKAKAEGVEFSKDAAKIALDAAIQALLGAAPQGK